MTPPHVLRVHQRGDVLRHDLVDVGLDVDLDVVPSLGDINSVEEILKIPVPETEISVPNDMMMWRQFNHKELSH